MIWKLIFHVYAVVGNNTNQHQHQQCCDLRPPYWRLVESFVMMMHQKARAISLVNLCSCLSFYLCWCLFLSILSVRVCPCVTACVLVCVLLSDCHGVLTQRLTQPGSLVAEPPAPAAALFLVCQCSQPLPVVPRHETQRVTSLFEERRLAIHSDFLLFFS